jgi:general secretion pathway protein F
MPLFHYEARDQSGKKVIGSMQVTDEGALTRRLQSMGYVPVLVQPARVKSPSPRVPAASLPSGPRLPTRVLAQFYYELYASLQAGIPAFQALHDVASRTFHPGMRMMAASMAEAARSGCRLADEMGRYPGAFDPAHVGLVRAGEMGGFLVEALKELTEQMEGDLEARRRCNLSIVYFWMVVAAALFAITASSIVRPAVAAGSAAAGLPAVLRTLITICLPVALVIAAGAFAFRAVIRRPRGRERWHRMLLRLPGLGALAVSRSRAVFAASLRLLYHGGVNPYDAWVAASSSAPNLELARRLGAQSELIRSGGKFSDAMQLSNVYPPSDVGLLATGERTGNIEEVLGRIANSYHQDAGAVLARLPLVVRVTLLLLGAAIAAPAFGLAVYKYFMGQFQGVDEFMGTG